ncbi:MAG: type II toxin-antitoxin system MqsA family antitoxin [Selenomonadaceae bacterium]|nr:type II toxin-antitoxin system MqsA family antitoxin [Selenomonadaceae bacterium]MBQ6131368.1 type II toxin-antitoxin system MqsA family antitoxin [Selenomonadaceae bacterium]
MNCLVCGSGTVEESFETYFAKLETGYLIIENVPCFKCSQCGESFFSMSVTEKIEELVAAYKKNAGKVSVIDYSKAA